MNTALTVPEVLPAAVETAAPAAPALRWETKMLFIGVSLLLSVTSLLLPIERGFPTVPVMGLPVVVSILVASVVFGLLAIHSQLGILRLLRDSYVLLQIAFMAVLILSSLRMETPRSGFAVALGYGAVFIANYMSLHYLFAHGGRSYFVHCLCLVAALAAGVGILEEIAGIRLPFYEYYNTLFRIEMGYGAELMHERTGGTLGNALIYAVAMVLVIPFAY